MDRSGGLIRLAGILVVIILFLPNVGAIIEEKSLGQLTEEADSIIIGTVESIESYWENGRIFTDVSISTSSNLKGANHRDITVKIPGGTVGTISAAVSDTPVFENNAKVIVFLDNSRFEADRRFRVTGCYQGKYTIVDGKIKETGVSVNDFVYSIQNNATSLLILDEKVEILAGPVITSISPDSGPAKAAKLGSSEAASDSTRVVVTGENFGFFPGSLEFWRSLSNYKEADIESWNDTHIIARIPGRPSSYSKPDGSGNVRVVTSGESISDGSSFYVTYSYGGGRWPGNSMTYQVNPNTLDTTGELDAIRAAANTWNGASSDFEFIYGGSTSKTDIGFDGENTILWVGYNTGSIATAWTYWNYLDPNTIIECDMLFNDIYYEWNTSGAPTPFQMDVQTIATHEFGHMLHLLDLYGTADSGKMMYGYGRPGMVKRTLHPDDIAGIVYIYGENPVVYRPYTFTTTDNAMKITVDGISRFSPYSVNWPDSEIHQMEVPQSQPTTLHTRYNFSHWSGKSTATSTDVSITTGMPSSGVYNANYDIQYYLIVNTSPSGLDDPEGEGWYNSGGIATATVDEVDGYRFDHWTGDATGTDLSTFLFMDSPKIATAVFELFEVEWNPWDDDCLISNVEISLAEYYWVTGIPINGHIISNPEISLLEYQWVTDDVCF